MTGVRADRRGLLKLLKAVAPGDVVTVTRIDRLARSTFDLFAIVKQFVDAKGQFLLYINRATADAYYQWKNFPAAYVANADPQRKVHHSQ